MLMNRRVSGWLAACVALACLLACATHVRGQNARAYTQSPLPKPTGYVSDNANVIDAATKSQMEAMLDSLAHQSDPIEFAVVTVPTTGDTDIFDYSLAVARGWGIGSSRRTGCFFWSPSTTTSGACRSAVTSKATCPTG
jgi:uncharacterized membrane protein YgcG